MFFRMIVILSFLISKNKNQRFLLSSSFYVAVKTSRKKFDPMKVCRGKNRLQFDECGQNGH